MAYEKLFYNDSRIQEKCQFENVTTAEPRTRMFEKGYSKAKREEKISKITKFFHDVYEDNRCKVIAESRTQWFFSITQNKMVILTQVSALKLRQEETTITTRELLGDSDGILKAVFCVPLTHEEPAVSDAQVDYTVSLDEYREISVDIPSLFANQIGMTNVDFNESKVLLKTHLEMYKAFITEEDHTNNLKFFTKCTRENREQDDVESKTKLFVETAKSFFNSRFVIERYREGISFSFSAKGRLEDILKYDESFNLEIQGEFNPEFLKSKITETDRKVKPNFLAIKNDYCSHGMMYFSSRKDAITYKENLSSNLNVENSQFTFKLDSIDRSASSVGLL